jgi:hypothetical protein
MKRRSFLQMLACLPFFGKGEKAAQPYIPTIESLSDPNISSIEFTSHHFPENFCSWCGDYSRPEDRKLRGCDGKAGCWYRQMRPRFALEIWRKSPVDGRFSNARFHWDNGWQLFVPPFGTEFHCQEWPAWLDRSKLSA